MIDCLSNLRGGTGALLPQGRATTIHCNLPEIEMTVCVAVIAQGSVICLADRMITAAGAQYPSLRNKIVPIAGGIAAMISGDDVLLAAELLSELRAEVEEWVSAGQQARVHDIVATWCEIHLRRQRLLSERAVLAPLGLTHDSFVEKQKLLDPKLAYDLGSELLKNRVPALQIIFAGIDDKGAHVFVATNGQAQCHDFDGFAVAGSGAYHARSELMVSGYTPSLEAKDALYRAYTAKKRAEIAQGVGKDTDTLFISTSSEQAQIRADIMACIADGFVEAEKQSAKVAEKVAKKVGTKVLQILEGPPAA